METVFGFRLWVIWDPVSHLPLAIRFRTIEHPDLDFAREVVSQAVSNLAPHATIASVAIDRGFMDGSFLWWLAQTMQITFYIPAKTNMNVYKDALSLLETDIAQGRERKCSVGAGKNKATVVNRWHVVGIEGLIPAFHAHVYLTIITMALTAAFQTWMDQQDKLAQEGNETGIRKFRQKVKQENGNKFIVFDENRYAIFDTYKVFILCGRTVLMPTGVPETITKRDISLKYGALLE